MTVPKKAKPQEVAACWVHRQETVPVLFLHEHHMHPQAYGGEDDPANLIWLCTGCHDILHRLASMASSGKGGQVLDALGIYLPDAPAARERLSMLVHEVVVAKAAFKAELATGEAADAPIDVTLSLPRSIHAALKTLSQDWTHGSGRRGGLAAYLEAMLSHHARSEGARTTTAPEEPTNPAAPERRPRRIS